MKVYRVVEYCDKSGNSIEFRIGTYMSKEKAKQVKKEQEEIHKQAEEQAILCSQCYDNVNNKCQQLCLSFKASPVDKSECTNYSTKWAPSFYRIDEEEVTEE